MSRNNVCRKTINRVGEFFHIQEVFHRPKKVNTSVHFVNHNETRLIRAPFINKGLFKKCLLRLFGVEIYFGAGEGYKRVSQTLCLPFYKVGTTALYGLKERFRQHKAEKHGSFWCDNGVYVEDKDFQDQFPSYIRTELQLSSNSPVRATRNSIVVVLPLGMSQLEFEYELQRALAHCAVHRFLQSDDGLRHCRLINVDPQVGIRMTGYGFGAGRRMSPADEIYTIRPHRDGDAMLTIAERIILRHLKLID